MVSKKKVREWISSKGNIAFFETSAKENYNVEEAFCCVALTALLNGPNLHDICLPVTLNEAVEEQTRPSCQC